MKILKINSQKIKKGILLEIAGSIKQGEVVVAPTDTVYGLVCDATNKKAVEKAFKLKQRPKAKPLPIFIKDINIAKELAEISNKQEKFLKKAWPGKTTAVLKLKIKNQKLKIYGIDKKTIALRIPRYKIINYLLSVVGSPLTGTSANISGSPASGDIKKVLNQFAGKKFQPDLVIDFGNLPKSKPSKIIDLTVFPYKILRD